MATIGGKPDFGYTPEQLNEVIKSPECLDTFDLTPEQKLNLAERLIKEGEKYEGINSFDKLGLTPERKQALANHLIEEGMENLDRFDYTPEQKLAIARQLIAPEK